MSATINYTLSYGVYPITVSISPEIAPAQIQYAPGTYSFTNVPPGSYTLTFADSGGCSVDLLANVVGTSPLPTLTPSLSPTPTPPLLAAIQYGLLYNFYAVADTRQITSIGWHIPNAEELLQLRNYLDPVNDDRLNNLAGQAMKETGTVHWLSPNVATNTSLLGFRGAGYRDPGYPSGGNFVFFNNTAGLWSSSEFDVNNGVNGVLVYDDDAFQFDIGNQYSNKKSGYSIRPIKDDSIDPGFYIGNDGKRYATVVVGNQVWTTENLAETKYRNSNIIPEVQSNNIWTGLTTGALSAFNNDWNNAYAPDPSVTPTLTINYTTTPSVTPSITRTSSNTPTRTPSRTTSVSSTQSPIIAVSPTPTRSPAPVGSIHYVSQTGNNSLGTGTLANPWATVSYAASQVLTSGHIIHILPGTISESTAFTLRSGVSLEGEGITSIIRSIYSGSFTINVLGNQSIHDLKMDGNSITAYGAIKASGLINNVKIYNNTIVDFSHFGISFENGNSSSPPSTFTTGNEIHDNTITNCSGYYGGNLGCVEIDGQDGILIYNNTMSADRGGLNCGDVIYGVEGHHKNVKIYNNNLTKTFIPGVTNWDFAIELWNEYDGNEIYGNTIIGSIDIVLAHGKGAGQYCTWIHDNIIGQTSPKASESTRGIDLEASLYTVDIIIERNYIHDVNMGVEHNLEMHAGNYEQNVRISYNVFNNITGSGGNRGWGVYYGYPPNRTTGVVMTNIDILNNVFIGGANGTWGIHLPDPGTATNVRVDNNIVQGFDEAIHADGVGGSSINILSIENNIFFNNSSNTWNFVNGITITNFTNNAPITSNPLFVSASDFHIQPGSPAINAGKDVGLTGTLDKGGVVINNPPEIGAYEFVGAISPTPSITPTKTPTKTVTISTTPTPSTPVVGARYVSPSGLDTNPGTLAQPWQTLNFAFNQIVPGQTLYMMGGTYSPLPTTYNATFCGVVVNNKNGTSGSQYIVQNYPSQTPILSGVNIVGSTYPKAGLYIANSSYWHITGLEIMGFVQSSSPVNVGTGLKLENTGNMTIERSVFHNNGGPGVTVRTSTGPINFLNCDAYENYDQYTAGINADGFDAGYNSPTAIITFTGCRSWDNSDDGFDMYNPSPYGCIVYCIDCWAFGNGWAGANHNIIGGDGNGFKIGPETADGTNGRRFFFNSIAFGNRMSGFNENTAGCRQDYYNNTSYLNGDKGWDFTAVANNLNIFRNNVSFNNTNAEFDYVGTPAINDHNTWNSIDAVPSDYINVDGTELTRVRRSDGSLPLMNFLHLANGSDQIAAGTSTGIYPTDGDGYLWSSIPAIGTFEFGLVPVSPTPTHTPSKSATMTPSPSITKSQTVTPSVTSTPSATPTKSLPIFVSSTPSVTPTRSPATGAIYYVNYSTGSDSNNGSLSTPWKTLAYASTHVTSGGTIHLLPCTHPITTAFTLPIGVNLEGDGVTSIISSTYSLFAIIVKGNQSIHDLKIDGSNISGYGAIKASGIINNVKIYNNTISNFSHFGISLENGNNSLPPSTFSTGNEIYNSSILNCSTYDGGNTGCLEIDGQDGLLIYNNIITADRGVNVNVGDCIYGVEGHLKNVKIYDNTISKAHFDGVSSWDFAIELWNLYNGNEIYNNNITGSVDIALAWGKNTSVGSGLYCVWIHNNTIGQDSLKFTDETMHGVLLENTHTDVIIEKNFIQNTTETIFVNLGYGNGQNASSGRFESSNNHQTNLRISYNVIYNTGSLTSSKGWGVYYSIEDAVDRQNTIISNVQIVNNVFIGGNNSMWGIQIPDCGIATNALIMNNIVKGFNYAPIFATGANGTSINILNVTKNILFGNGNSNNILLTNGFSPSSYTYDPPIKLDPLFISSTDFHLQGGSPAIGAGTTVASPLLQPMTTDKDGVTIGSPPEIGAYELSAAPLPSKTPTVTVSTTTSRTPSPSRQLSVSVTPTLTITSTPSKSLVGSQPASPSITQSKTPSKTPTPSPLVGATIIEGLNITCTDTGTSACVQYSTYVGGSTANFIFRNNYISAVNTGGYVVQLGDDGPGGTNDWLHGELVSGNKIVWGGGTYGTSITHGLIVGYEINAQVKYNYLDNAPYQIIYKSGDGTSAGNYFVNTSGGASYNIVRNGRFAARVKGINGVRYLNNTFFTGDGQSWYRALISPNTDYSLTVGSMNTKFFNNIFYSTTSAVEIRIYDNCLGGVTGFESDYNLFYCEAGSPIFEIGNQTAGFTQYSLAQWQAMGYDTHSVVVNPNFNNLTNFVPAARLNYGLNLNTKFSPSTEYQAGLSLSAVWTVGQSPATQVQSGAWQVGAIILP